jgi:hypothetical protein
MGRPPQPPSRGRSEGAPGGRPGDPVENVAITRLCSQTGPPSGPNGLLDPSESSLDLRPFAAEVFFGRGVILPRPCGEETRRRTRWCSVQTAQNPSPKAGSQHTRRIPEVPNLRHRPERGRAPEVHTHE